MFKAIIHAVSIKKLILKKAINQSAISNIPCSSKWVSEFIKSVLSINKILKIFNVSSKWKDKGAITIIEPFIK